MGAVSGTSTFGPIDVSSSTGYGTSINIAANAGDVRAQCQQTASQYTQLYGAYMGSNLMFSVLANGTVSDGIGPLRRLGQNIKTTTYTLVATDAGKMVRVDNGSTNSL